MPDFTIRQRLRSECAKTIRWLITTAFCLYGALTIIAFFQPDWIVPFVEPAWFLWIMLAGFVVLLFLPDHSTEPQSLPTIKGTRLIAISLFLVMTGLFLQTFLRYHVPWPLSFIGGGIAAVLFLVIRKNL